MIGKIEKAHRYAEERSRFRFSGLAVTIQGDNDNHEVRFEDGSLVCGCDFFAHASVCAHTMAVERLLAGMLPVPVQPIESTSNLKSGFRIL